VRRVSVTSRARGRLAAGLVFSAPATLCTHSKYSSTGRRANGRTGSGYENRRRGVECGPMAGTAATRRRGRGGCARGGPRFGSGEARRGRDGHPIAAAPGRPSGPGFAAGAGVSCSRDRRHETRAPSLRKRATETVAPAAKAGALHPSCKDPSWARAWRSVDGDRMPASGVCPCGPFSWPLPARSCSRDRRHATRALLL
jgi:hypothetical protein